MGKNPVGMWTGVACDSFRNCPVDRMLAVCANEYLEFKAQWSNPDNWDMTHIDEEKPWVGFECPDELMSYVEEMLSGGNQVAWRFSITPKGRVQR